MVAKYGGIIDRTQRSDFVFLNLSMVFCYEFEELRYSCTELKINQVLVKIIPFINEAIHYVVEIKVVSLYVLNYFYFLFHLSRETVSLRKSVP